MSSFKNIMIFFLLKEIKSEIAQESNQLKSFVELGSDLSQSGVLANVQSLLDTTKYVSEEFARLESSANERWVEKVV